MTPPADISYTPISAADAVILYAGNFVPSWAGAIAIDLLPAVLVLILAVTQGAIRAGRDGTATEDSMTLAELRAALAAARDLDTGARLPPPEAGRATAQDSPTPPPAAPDAPVPNGAPPKA